MKDNKNNNDKNFFCKIVNAYEDILQKYIDKTIRIPMKPTLRSLNLSNSVAIITYEILRQHNFEDLQEISTYFDE